MLERKDSKERFLEYMCHMQPKQNHCKKLSFKGFGLNLGTYAWNDATLLYAFQAVEEIDFSHNYIDEVPFDCSKFPKLKTLDISYNALYYWGGLGTFRIGEQVNSATIEVLKMTHGNMGHAILQQGKPLLTSLKELDLSFNQFGRHLGQNGRQPLKLRLSKFDQLHTLKLRGSFYRGVPKLRFMPTIEQLDLGENRLQCNFQELLTLPKLKSVALDYNHLNKIPKIFFQLKQLESLDLSGNPIVEERHQIENLQNHLPNTRIILSTPKSQPFWDGLYDVHQFDPNEH